MSAAPTFAEVLCAALQRKGWYLMAGLSAEMDGFPRGLLVALFAGAQPTAAEAVALATALNLSGGAWTSFLSAAGVATEAGGGS